MVRARSEKALAGLVDKLNKAQQAFGELKKLEERQHNGVKYQCRIERNQPPGFYFLIYKESGKTVKKKMAERQILDLIKSDRFDPDATASKTQKGGYRPLATYREFEDPEELRGDLQHFLRRVAQGATSTPISPGTRQIWRWIPWTLIRDRCEATIWCPWVDRSHSVEPVLRRDPPLARRPLRNSQQF